MASEKVIAILHSRGAPYTLEEMKNMKEKEAWDWVYTHREPKKPKPNLLEVCFTGFTPETKDKLKEIAKQNGIIVRHSVSKNLKFLIVGESPGPTKVGMAEAQGVQLLNEESFYKLVNTGEIDE
jgi:NAD-dependent DNA ligase